MSSVIPESDQKIVDECRDKMLEHFDSVCIFVSRHSGEKSQTHTYKTGGGNFCAQIGHIWEWLNIQKQFQKNWAIRKDEE